jgi:DNA ligase-1
MNEIDVLEKLSQTPSHNEKAKILENNKSNTQLLELLNACYNYKRKFFIRKFDTSNFVATGTVFPNLHSHFVALLNKLETKAIVGNEVRTAVNLFLLKCDSLQTKWYSRVLRKDLKAGLSEDTVVLYTPIPIFKVQLAKDGKECKKALAVLSKGVYLSPKFDGYRCLAVIEDNHVTLFSRNGTVYDNFPTIEDSLIKSFPNQKFILDGEIMSADFQAMQSSAFASKRGTTVGDVTFHVFDTIEWDEWENKIFVEKKSSRYERLKVLSKSFCPNVQLVVQTLIYTVKDALAAEVLYMSQGFEGAMTCPDIPYYLGKKSNKLMKWKTMISEDCEITGFYEGSEDTKNVGKMGGFVLKQENGKTCECGSGFSDVDREYIWNNQAEFLGRTIEVKYQEKTQHDIMRFPVFKRFRDDKAKK